MTSSDELIALMTPQCRAAWEEYESHYMGGMGGGRHTAAKALAAGWEAAMAIAFETRMTLAQTDTRYLGVLTLLGRVAKFIPIGHEDRYGLDRAFADANTWLDGRNSFIRYERTGGSGYAAFENTKLTKAPTPGRWRPEETQRIQWEPMPFRMRGFTADVEGGRLAVRRAKGARLYRGTWNGAALKPVSARDPAAAQAQAEEEYRSGRLLPMTAPHKAAVVRPAGKPRRG